MANTLSYEEIRKTFYNGPLVGEMRLNMITRKIDNKDTFQVVGEPEPIQLMFAKPKFANAFKNENLDKIMEFTKGRVAKGEEPFMTRRPTKDNPRRYFKLTQLIKTEEFGGKGGEGGGGGPADADPHELMTAALILKYGSGAVGPTRVDVKDYNNNKSIRTSLETLKTSWAPKVDGSKTKEQNMFILDKMSAYAQAISAANTFLSRLGKNSRVVNVYQTGAKWPNLLVQAGLRINDHKFFGKKDYNSSDLIVEVQTKKNGVSVQKYIGISLKKKGTSPTAADPTVINKTVMGAEGLMRQLVKDRANNLTGTIVDRKFKAVYRARAQFFFDVIKATLENSKPEPAIGAGSQKHYMNKYGIVQQRLTKPRKLPNGEEVKIQNQNEAIEDFLYNKSTGLYRKIGASRERAQHIVKIAKGLGQGFLTQALQHKAELTDPKTGNGAVNNYFKAFSELFEEDLGAKPLCMSLLNIVFKTDLMTILQSRKAYKTEFMFTLITGRGQEGGSGILVEPAHELFEGNTTSWLQETLSEQNKPVFAIKRIGVPAWEGGPAKTQHECVVNGIPIIKLELRYKGSITAEPQFQAYITTNFKEVIKAKKYPEHVW